MHTLKTCLLLHTQRSESSKARTSYSAGILATSVRSLAFKSKHKYAQKNGSVPWLHEGSREGFSLFCMQRHIT